MSEEKSKKSTPKSKSDKITALRFAQLNSFRRADKITVERMYGQEERTESAWDKEFKGKFVYINKK